MAARKRHLQQGDGDQQEDDGGGTIPGGLSSNSDLQQAQDGDSLQTASGDDTSNTVVIYITRSQIRLLTVCGALLVILVAIGMGLVLNDNQQHWTPNPEDYRQVGPEALALFRQHDVNNDGNLNLKEFEPLGHILVDVNVTITYDLPIEPEDNVITIGAHFQPLNLSTMQIFDNEFLDWTGAELAPLTALKAWTSANIESKNYAAKDFALFSPKEEPMLGKAYRFTPFGPFSTDEIELKYSMFSSNRFYPPRVSGELMILHNLLAMLHPRPFINSRFPPQGSLACVRAVSDDFLDISFRVHAEFQLQEVPKHPFWFTPAQFKGRLIISKDHKHVKYLRVYVPNDKRLNVDMEWLKSDDGHNMEVDIGYMGQMELRSTGPSRPATYEGYDIRESLKPETTPAEDILEGLTWTKEVQVDMCERAMEIEFYPFKKVPYYNFTEAFERASTEKKLVHSIVLWGALDDQSC